MDQIEKYFNAEKNESVLFFLVGIFAIALGVDLLFKTENAFLKSFAYPFIVIALIQISVGASVFLRTPSDIKRAESYLQDKSKIVTLEIPRMEKVMKSFSLYKKIEIALLLIGLLLFIVFKNSALLKGIGLGLAIQAGIMLTLDLFAESRGKTYIKELKKITNSK